MKLQVLSYESKMARVKLTEHKAKSLLYDLLGYSYHGVSIDRKGLSQYAHTLSKDKKYVVKVDQGIKKRMKQGLVKLRVSSYELRDAIDELAKKGYDQFIIEEMLPHNQSDERYLAVERIRKGMLITYSKKGGIDVEEHASEVKRAVIPYYRHPELGSGSNRDPDIHRDDVEQIAKELGIDINILKQLREFCEKYFVSFLEINPLVVRKGKVWLLDLAIEVDSTAQFFIRDGWNENDIVSEKHKTYEEIAVAALNKKSQAAFTLTLLNPNGSIWVLLSGGGASVTIADEIHNLGFGKQLGNYGEYSGNPNAEETYLYTCSLLALLLKSNQRRLMLIIGGGVANFTDIRITFKGIIQALAEYKNKLKKKKIKIFVRRGGPHEFEGLTAIEEWLKENKMYGLVSGHVLPLNEVVGATIKELRSPPSRG